MSGLSNWQRVYCWLGDVLFPPRCLGCRRFGNWICPHCESRIETIKTPICYKCQRLSADFRICSTCRQIHPALNRIIVYSYWQSPLKEIVYGLKYHRVRPAINILGNWLADVAVNFCADTDLLIVPVPLHRRRLWERGFNQAELLAQNVAGRLRQPVARIIMRQKYTKPQFGLKKPERLSNIKGAFKIALKYQAILTGKTILLVDDLVTTGATLGECAKVLKQNGAREVWGLVLAKA